MDKNFFIGLDVGSDSVGWAVTDEHYELVRLKGKTAWGSRIFDSGSDAKNRRQLRSNRRRMARRKYRISLLNELFAEQISKIDSNFFLRLSQSNLTVEDKSSNQLTPYPLFNSKGKELIVQQLRLRVVLSSSILKAC